MKKKLLFLVLGTVLLVSGCSAKDEAQEVTESVQEEVTQTVIAESTTEEVTQTVIAESMLEEEVQTVIEETVEETTIVEETVTQIQETDIIEENMSSEMTIEEIMQLAEKGILATQELKVDDLLSYTNMEAMYCLGNGIPFNEAENKVQIEALINDPTANLGIVGYYSLLENVDVYDAVLLETEELEALNQFIAGQVNTVNSEIVNYTVEKAYKVKVSYDGIEEENYAEGDEPYLLVFYVNGRWELDLFIEVMREMYQALSDLESLMQMAE